jgi:hypothetical protein
MPLGIYALGLALFLPACIGLPSGVLGWTLARSDLAKMRAGLMDPWDYHSTEAAATGARAGVLLNGLGLLLVGGFLLVLLWR